MNCAHICSRPHADFILKKHMIAWKSVEIEMHHPFTTSRAPQGTAHWNLKAWLLPPPLWTCRRIGLFDRLQKPQNSVRLEC
jgi:hypothetical protein